MTARLVYESPPPPSIWGWLGNAIVIVMESFVEAYHMRKGIVELHRLDDRMLADIGVSRSGIEAAVRDGHRKTNHVPRVAEATQPMAKAA